MTAQEKLTKKNNEQKVICVGLDSDLNKIPSHLKSSESPILEFNKAIIESTYKFAAAYKVNFAFYEKNGAEGFEVIEKTISLIPDDILIIADAKRGDIGNTSQMYASAVYDYFKCDAVTIHPYMGSDSVNPFLENKGKINFILALTSNKGANDFEKLRLEDGSFLFQNVIKKVKEWNKNKNCGIVFGATQIEELSENVKLFGDLPVLLPGIGAQGGSLEDVIKVFKTNNRLNILINSSRGIIYRDNSNKFAESAKNEIIRLNEIVKNTLKL
ncbi:MAG: orotidine-5'-phosphate decarboxylase [Ignavibacteriaceae bacterium]